MRTRAGWRAYGPDQLRRLHEILALKGVGLSLAAVADLLADRNNDLDRTLEVQRAALADRQRILDASIALVEAAQAKRRNGGPLSLDELTQLIQESAIMDQNDQAERALRALYGRNLNPDELSRIEGFERASKALYAELKTLADRNEDPASDVSLDFWRRWHQLARSFVDGDADFMNKVTKVSASALADPDAANAVRGSSSELNYLNRIEKVMAEACRRLSEKTQVLVETGASPDSAEAFALVVRARALVELCAGFQYKSAPDTKARKQLRGAFGAPSVIYLQPDVVDFLARAAESAEALV